jgi:hypothetical protein
MFIRPLEFHPSNSTCIPWQQIPPNNTKTGNHNR